MKIYDLCEGLATLRPYYHEDKWNLVNAGHEQLYAKPTDLPLTPEDVKRMRKLGWFQMYDSGGECEEYNPEFVWSAFVG